MKFANIKSGIRLRVVLGQGVALGPGKADLMQAIRETGSIAAAGRRMRMSYKRAWYLVEELNTAFREPLVLSSQGGAAGGGATLSRLGERVLDTYRRMEGNARAATESDFKALRRTLAAGD